jgi:hypothetical protein
MKISDRQPTLFGMVQGKTRVQQYVRRDNGSRHDKLRKQVTNPGKLTIVRLYMRRQPGPPNSLNVERRKIMILLIILVLLLIGALPTWPYSSGWGYYPSGGLGLILVIILILVALGYIRF